MILTAHQPAYLPWLGFFHKIAIADKFIFFDDVKYDAEDWINRNQIKTRKGPLMLTVTVFASGDYKNNIASIKIKNSLPWRRKHWMTIQLEYGSSSYFKMYADFFYDLYSREWECLADFNLHMLEWFLKTLGISVVIQRANECSFSGKKSDLILDMSRKNNATAFIFGEQGIGYADKEKFRQCGVIPYFRLYKHPQYQQLHGDFIPNLSIIDLIFNMGPNSLEILMANNITKQGLVNIVKEQGVFYERSQDIK